MEIVLLWLDEFDDWLFAAALVWRNAARYTLSVGLAAALAMAVGSVLGIYTSWIDALTAVAAASVVIWSVAAIPVWMGSRRAPILQA
jgi:hypothetical protein